MKLKTEKSEPVTDKKLIKNLFKTEKHEPNFKFESNQKMTRSILTKDEFVKTERKEKEQDRLINSKLFESRDESYLQMQSLRERD